MDLIPRNPSGPAFSAAFSTTPENAKAHAKAKPAANKKKNPTTLTATIKIANLIPHNPGGPQYYSQTFAKANKNLRGPAATRTITTADLIPRNLPDFCNTCDTARRHAEIKAKRKTSARFNPYTRRAKKTFRLRRRRVRA